MKLSCSGIALIALVYSVTGSDTEFQSLENLQVSLEFIRGSPFIDVTWDPPAAPNSTNIKFYEVSIISKQNYSTILVNSILPCQVKKLVKMSEEYSISLKAYYTSTGYGEAINATIAARYLQNLTVQQVENTVTTQCHTAKSDIAVLCQMTILELPYSGGNISVVAKAVDSHGTPLESYNITRTFLAPSNTSSGAQSNDDQNEVISPLTISLIAVVVILLIVVAVILMIVCTVLYKKRKVTLGKESMKIINSMSTHDSISINLPSPEHDSQQHNSPTNTSSPRNSPSTKKRIQYVNIPDCPLPVAVRHSTVPMEDCPAYKKRSKTCVNRSNSDYDDIMQSTQVKMQQNPAYRHTTFTYV